MNERYRNVYFWTGLIGVIVAASGVDVQTLVTWPLVLDALMDVLRNPLAVVSVVMAVIGVFVNPTTSGLND